MDEDWMPIRIITIIGKLLWRLIFHGGFIFFPQCMLEEHLHGAQLATVAEQKVKTAGPGQPYPGKHHYRVPYLL